MLDLSNVPQHLLCKFNHIDHCVQNLVAVKQDSNAIEHIEDPSEAVQLAAIEFFNQ